jgi:hypothetical protein
MTSERERLLPCPFCGDSHPKFYADERGFTAYLCVQCPTCSARADTVTYSIRENGIDHDSDERYVPPEYQKAAAARRWNARASAEQRWRNIAQRALSSLRSYDRSLADHIEKDHP